VACVLEIRNCGNHPIKLPAITAVLVYVDNSPGSIVTVTSQDNVVLMNGDVQQHKLFLIAQGKKELRSEDYIVGVSVDCCDLAGVSQHSFYFDDRSGLRHYFGFKAEEPPRALRKLLKAIKRASNVMGAGLKLK
jgi:hypothetical protein